MPHRLTHDELDRHLTADHRGRVSVKEHRLAHQPPSSGLWQTWHSWLRRVAATAALVQSATGPCVVNGDCVCSSNFQAARCAATSDASRRYGNDEACNVTFTQPVALHVHLFNTEKGSDLLFADGAKYSGTHGPDGVVASALSWHSDDSARRSGFKICAHPVPAPPPPPPPAAPHAPPWPELVGAREAAAAAAAAAAARRPCSVWRRSVTRRRRSCGRGSARPYSCSSCSSASRSSACAASARVSRCARRRCGRRPAWHAQWAAGWRCGVCAAGGKQSYSACAAA